MLERIPLKQQYLKVVKLRSYMKQKLLNEEVTFIDASFSKKLIYHAALPCSLRYIHTLNRSSSA